MTNDTKTTSAQAATHASDVLQDAHTSEQSKAAAASALSQRKDGKHTSEEAAEHASKVLRDGRSSEASKAAAASALSQRASTNE